MSSRKVIRTGDGSASLFDEGIGESYHSSHGALTESLHVFLQAGLEAMMPSEHVSVLEIGLGTGLNAVLSQEFSRDKGVKLDYLAVEGYPMDLAFIPDLEFGLGREQMGRWEELMRAPWEEWITWDGFRLFKMESLFEDMELPQDGFDVVYFDAFSPAHQPEVWSDDILGKVVSAMKEGGVFVTYCCRGHVKRSLKGLGLEVEKLPGPPGKREMLRAWKRSADL